MEYILRTDWSDLMTLMLGSHSQVKGSRFLPYFDILQDSSRMFRLNGNIQQRWAAYGVNLNQPRNFRWVNRPQIWKKKNVTGGIGSHLPDCGTPALHSAWSMKQVCSYSHLDWSWDWDRTYGIWRILPNLRASSLSVDLPLYWQKLPFQNGEPRQL